MHQQLNGRATMSESDIDVARAILRHGPLPRSEVARLTGLTSGAVTKVTRKLLEKGLIEEGVPEPRDHGRPIVPLSVVDESARCLGVKLVPGAAFLAVVGLTGQVHELNRVAIDTSSLGAVIGALAEAVAAGGFSAVGVALPAAVSSDGTLHATRMLGWPGGDNLEEALTRATGLPVSVANDVHGLTQHAQWFGPLKGFRDAVLITLGQGIGVGAVVDDELLIGDQGAASILGRLWTPEGELFGDLLSIEALEARALEAGVGDAQFPALLADPAAQETVDFTVRTLGQLTRAAAIAYAPRRILLTGEAIRILDGRMGLVEAELGRDWRDDLDQPELVVEPLEVSAFAVGAAGLAVRSLFLPS